MEAGGRSTRARARRARGVCRGWQRGHRRSIAGRRPPRGDSCRRSRAEVVAGAGRRKVMLLGGATLDGDATSGGTSSRARRSASSRPRPTGATAGSRRCQANRTSSRCRILRVSPDRGPPGPLFVFSSGPRTSALMQIMSEPEARGPKDHERAWRPAVRKTLFLLDVPDTITGENDVAAHGVSPRHRLLELAERDGRRLRSGCASGPSRRSRAAPGIALADELPDALLQRLRVPLYRRGLQAKSKHPVNRQLRPVSGRLRCRLDGICDRPPLQSSVPCRPGPGPPG